MHAVDVIIPMRDNHHLTAHLCDQLAGDDYDRLWVYDNGSTDPEAVSWLAAPPPGVEVVDWGPKRGLYAMWNDAWQRSLDALYVEPLRPPRYLAVLNNDLEIPPRFLHHLAGALDHSDDDIWVTYPDWKMGWPTASGVTGQLIRTTGSRNSGGMSGFAFMLDVSRHITDGLPFVDEGYLWLGGDGDLVVSIEERGGFAACVEGLPVGHIEGATKRRHGWTEPQGRRDMARSRQPGNHNWRYARLQEARRTGKVPQP